MGKSKHSGVSGSHNRAMPMQGLCDQCAPGLRHFRFYQPSQQVSVAALTNRVQQIHPVIGHRGSFRHRFDFASAALPKFSDGFSSCHHCRPTQYTTPADSIPTLWQCLYKNWLSLTIPNLSDKAQIVWLNYPLWGAAATFFQNLIQNLKQMKLIYFTGTPLPSDDCLFRGGCGGLAAFLAREGIANFVKDLDEYLRQACHYHTVAGRKEGQNFESDLQERGALKARRYHTPRSRPKGGNEGAGIGRKAEAYRKAKEGGDENA